VIATQNPAHQIGTFPLPESQLDRFLMRIELGYPDRARTRAAGGRRPASAAPNNCHPWFSRPICRLAKAKWPPCMPQAR
jgi:hypothetical protein